MLRFHLQPEVVGPKERLRSGRLPPAMLPSGLFFFTSVAVAGRKLNGRPAQLH